MSISRMATVQSYSHCSDVWPLFSLWPQFSHMATVKSCGRCSVVWPQFSHMATVKSCGRCSVVWPLFSRVATVQSCGHCSVVWPLLEGQGSILVRSGQ